MRDSVLHDGVIAAILRADGVSIPEMPVAERIRQALDFWEKPVKDAAARRDGMTRAAFGYAVRRLQQAGRQTTAADGWDDPNVLRAIVDFWEAMAAVWRAEEARGVFTDWLPPYLRDDPFGELRREVVELRARIAELEGAELLARLADQARDARARQMAALSLLRSVTTTAQYSELPPANRAEIEAGFGLDPLLENHIPRAPFSDEIREDALTARKRKTSDHRNDIAA